MATIVTSKGADGPSFQARVRLTKNREIVFKESKTFATKVAAREWAKCREVELKDPKSLILAKTGGPTFSALVRWYIDT